jgi:hypothetical protein
MKRLNIVRVTAIALVCIGIAAGVGCKAGVFRASTVSASSNSMLVLAPYRHAGTWVFDDPRRGLTQEAFVSGIPEMIDHLVSDIPDADKGFRLTFSAQEFPGYEDRLVWKRKGTTGNWYYSEACRSEGWLCPALFKYFKEAPKTIYVKADAK